MLNALDSTGEGGNRNTMVGALRRTIVTRAPVLPPQFLPFLRRTHNAWRARHREYPEDPRAILESLRNGTVPSGVLLSYASIVLVGRK